LVKCVERDAPRPLQNFHGHRSGSKITLQREEMQDNAAGRR
jgi:hypothetical protein